MSYPSVVVIGGGVNGLGAALKAAELGCSEVTLLERDHLGSGSSGLSAGVYNINGTDALTIEIRVRCRELLDKFERENGLVVYRQGHLRLARKEHHVALFESAIEMQRALGVEPAVLLDPAEVKKSFPDLYVDDLLAALYGPLDGHLDGAQLCQVLADRARALGVKVLQQTPMVGAGRGTRRHHRIKTTKGDLEADVVVNAAGPWAMKVGDMLGAPAPLINQLHEVVRMRLPRALAYTFPMVEGYIPGEEEAMYFRQEGPRELIGGMHTYSALGKLGSADPDQYRKTVTWRAVEEVAKLASYRLPLDDLGFNRGWTGLYPVSADELFQVGPYAFDPSIIMLGGMGGSGVCSGVALGPVAAEWAVNGGPTSIPGAAVFAPDRFTLKAVGEMGPDKRQRDDEVLA